MKYSNGYGKLMKIMNGILGMLEYKGFRILIILENATYFKCFSSQDLTHPYRETRKRVIGKQCRPRSDAT